MRAKRIIRDELRITELLGKTLVSIDGAELYSEAINFVTAEGARYLMYHDQDCCEDVSLVDVCGDVNHLLGLPLLQAEESSNANETPEGVTPPEDPDSYTWTFYRLATARGSVVLRWLGESNGYYGEGVDLVELEAVTS